MRWLEDLWPFVSLAIAVAGLAAAAAGREAFTGREAWFFFLWLHLPAFMLHQFEEYGVPGGFREWWNTRVFGSRNPDFPLSRRLAMAANFPALYAGFGALGVLGVAVAPWLGMIALFATFTNAYFHISYAIAAGRYVPGVVTSLVLYLPLTGWAAYHFARTGEIGPGQFALALAAGMAVNLPVFGSARALMRRHPERLAAPDVRR